MALDEVIGIQGSIDPADKDSENLPLLDLLDNYFRGQRGYVVRMPDQGTPVVACMSGGGDSITNIAILLKEYGLTVYPFFVNRGQSNYRFEKAAVNYFDTYFKKQFPDQYFPCKELTVDTPAREYKSLLTETLTSNHISYPSRNSVIFLTGAEYGYALKQRGVNITTMFAAHLSSDRSMHCSLTWTRITNLTLCHIMNNKDWQFISLPIEREFGNYYDKDVFVRYCLRHEIPLEKTRTCVKDTEVQCGICPCCWDRRRCYAEVGVDDPTEYLFPMPDSQPKDYQQDLQGVDR